MTPLAAGAVQHAGPIGEPENVEQSHHLLPIHHRVEQGLEFEEVALIEVLCPPLGPRLACRRARAAYGLSSRQKNTGSRYAPNFSSMACRISYSVHHARAQSRMYGMRFASVPAASVSACRRASTSA